MIFNGSERLVGKGAQAEVYLFDGYAYKLYKDGYPVDWINFEIKMQNEINKTKLKTVKYCGTENPHIIKMDFIDGVNLLDYYGADEMDKMLLKLAELQTEIHKEKGASIPHFVDFFKHCFENLNCGQPHYEAQALECLKTVPDGDCLCHLDFHPLNVMVSKNEFYIIDWINARIGNPIFDFARTYLLLCETSEEIGNLYKNIIAEKNSLGNFDKAVFVIALQRTTENDSEFLRRTIEKYYSLSKK